MKKMTIKQIAFIGLMGAMVCVLSKFPEVRISTPLGDTRLHLGNAMCLLSGMILGPLAGGLSAGIGSALYDVISGWYTSIPTTFLFKFVMGFVCGKIVSSKKMKPGLKYTLGSIAGAFSYVLLYLGNKFVEDYIIVGGKLSIVAVDIGQKAVISSINAVLAVIIAIPLGLALKPAIAKILK